MCLELKIEELTKAIVALTAKIDGMAPDIKVNFVMIS